MRSSFLHTDPTCVNGAQVRDSFDLDDARRSYFQSLFPLNAGGIVPAGPTLADLALHRPHGRGPADTGAVFALRPGSMLPAMSTAAR
jgi:hypothetical protein